MLRRAVEHALERALPAAGTSPPRLHAAMRWAVLSPGKRLRPLFVLASCAAAGGPWRRALPAAAAVELVHAFSLVHDDLPAMDDDDYRRGRLTTHRKFGEALGVLAGDALLALAFEQVARLAAHGVPAPRVTAAVAVLARAAGSRELIAGQTLDLAAENRRVSLATVRDIHRRKTGALIAASMELGALAAGARPLLARRMAAIGHDLGLAFQIQDDLLNRGSSLARLGKRAGTDEARGKATFPRAAGEERSRAEAERLLARARRRVERMGPRAGTLLELIDAVAGRRH
jgi:geranylgeranyl pyrophosphate synthase